MAEACVEEIVKERKPIFNKSTTFVRSMLGYSPLFFGYMYYNTYISVNPERMYIVFSKPSKNTIDKDKDKYEKQYPYIFETLKKHSCFLEDISTDTFTIFIFSIPENYSNDFYLFLEGAYSKMSTLYKEELLALHSPIPNAYEKVKGILYPAPHHKEYLAKKLGVDIDMIKEIFSKIEYSEEVFDVNNLVE